MTDDDKLLADAPVKPAGRTQKSLSSLSTVALGSSVAPKVYGDLQADQTASAPEGSVSGERDSVFRQLVKQDSDIAGLVAYSIYKQNKLDWLNAFEQWKGRAPNADELAAYTIGEGTPRRLVTYRHLAEAMLAGHGPEAGTEAAAGAGGGRRGIATLDRSPVTPGALAAYVLIAALFLVGFFVAAHYTMSSH